MNVARSTGKIEHETVLVDRVGRETVRFQAMADRVDVLGRNDRRTAKKRNKANCVGHVRTGACMGNEVAR